MAVAVAASTIAEVDGPTSIACAVPAGTAAGDVLAVAMTHGVSSEVGDQSGWTTVAKATIGTTPTAMFYRVAGGSEPASYDFTSGGGRCTVSMHRLTGVDTATPLDAAPLNPTQTSASSLTTASVTTVTAGALMLYDVSVQSSSATITPDASTTQATVSTGTGRRQVVAWEARPSAGATGSRLWAFSSSLPSAAVVAAFRPAPEGDPTDAKFRSSSSESAIYTDNVGYVAVPAPAGVQPGDVMIAAHGGDRDGSAGGLTAPAGWTLIGAESEPVNAGHLKLWHRVATAADEGATYQFGKPDNVFVSVGIVAFSDADPVVPAVTFAESSALTTSMPAPSISGVVGGQLLTVHLAGEGDNSWRTFTAPSGMTERVDEAWPSNVDSWIAVGMNTQVLGGNGSTGTRTATCSDDAAYVTASLLVAPSVLRVPTVDHRIVGVPVAGTGRVSTRVTDATSARLKVGTDPAVTTGVIWGDPVVPDSRGDAHLTVTGLAAGTQYFYRVAMTDADGVEHLDDEATVGSFRTAPVAGDFAFCFGSCTDAADSASFAAIAARDDDLFLHLGDLYYADGTGTGLSNFRARMTGAVQAPNLQAVTATTPTVYTPSDHDGMTDDSEAGSQATAWANWNTAFREHFPVAGLVPATTGSYYTFVWGRVRFIVLDTRSFKSPSGNADNSSKTALGSTQKAWLKETISAATEPAIVLVQDGYWIGPAETGEDNWTGYTTERAELAAFFAGSAKHIAMLGGDMHAVAADDGSNSPGGIAVFQGAPFHKSASQKGGPYSSGPYPSSGSSVVQQYGRVAVTDGGSTITLAFTGYSADGTARVTETVVFDASQTVDATFTAAGTLTAGTVRDTVDDVLINGSGTLTYSLEHATRTAAALTVRGRLSAVAVGGAIADVGFGGSADLDTTIQINGQTRPAFATATAQLAATVTPGAVADSGIYAGGDLLVRPVVGVTRTARLTATATLTASFPVWRDITVRFGPYLERSVAASYRE